TSRGGGDATPLAVSWPGYQGVIAGGVAYRGAVPLPRARRRRGGGATPGTPPPPPPPLFPPQLAPWPGGGGPLGHGEWGERRPGTPRATPTPMRERASPGGLSSGKEACHPSIRIRERVSARPTGLDAVPW